MRRVPAPFLVHIFTACGAGCALMALLEAARGQWVLMFVWLAVALVIDGVDGTLARRFRVAEILPRWSGNALDLVVDFTTYVFVPAFALATSGLLPASVAAPLAIAIVVVSALYFADEEMKTQDNFFRGFPALWNAVAFHLFVLKLPPWANACVVAALVILTFMPLRVLHPFRVTQFRRRQSGRARDLEPARHLCARQEARSGRDCRMVPCCAWRLFSHDRARDRRGLSGNHDAATADRSERLGRFGDACRCSRSFSASTISSSSGS